MTVVETLVETLPECQVRHLAYATFAVLQVFHGREAYLVEYDSPPLILVRNGEALDLPLRNGDCRADDPGGPFTLENGDTMVLVSDGYVHAGVGGLYRMGWGWKNIATAVERWAETGGDTQQLVAAPSRTCLKLSGSPGTTPPPSRCACAPAARPPSSLALLRIPRLTRRPSSA